jgi:hypothetical protein
VIDNGSGAPTLTVEDIVGGCDQVNQTSFVIRRHKVSLRYHLRVDDHLSQSRFLVEAFDPIHSQRNRVWSISPATYAFANAADPPAVTAPRSRLIASPYNRDMAVKAASWQKIIDTLTETVYQIFNWPS